LIFFGGMLIRLSMTGEDQKKIAARRVQELRKSLGMTQGQFADFIGVDGENGQSTVSKWESAKQLPGAEYTAKMASRTNRNPLYFSGLDIVEPFQSRSSRTCPLMGEIQAGVWREAIEFHPEEQRLVEFPSEDMPPFTMQAFLVRGDSMDRIYPAGAIVYVAGVIENALTPGDGDIVLVQRMDGHGRFEATLKELVIRDDGSKWLWPRSTNPEFQAPISVGQRDAEDYDVQITGIVQGAFIPARRRPHLHR
jgi:SOS-response transcriptional repressor LexA